LPRLLVEFQTGNGRNSPPIEIKHELEFVKRPFLLPDQHLSSSANQLKEPAIVDEVQKVPELLDEIHWLIENMVFRFILCGSSARKLK